MIYTKLIKKAIGFSIQVHETDQKQKRKGKDIAYIVHPLSVGLILARAGASEDVIVAGILHDTLEDSVAEKKITKATLVEEFNEEIANLVLSVTEQNKELPWEVRKREALDHIGTFSHGALLVKSADILNNATELLEDYEKNGDAVFERFNAGKEKIIGNQLRAINAIINCWKENPLARDLVFLANDLQMIGASYFMPNSPAKIIEHKDYDEKTELECPVCGWKGTPRSSGCINTDSHFAMDVSCPICGKMILIADYAST